MSALEERKIRIDKFLNWLKEQDGITKYELYEYFYNNWRPSEVTINGYYQQMLKYQDITQKGGKYIFNVKRRHLI